MSKRVSGLAEVVEVVEVDVDTAAAEHLKAQTYNPAAVAVVHRLMGLLRKRPLAGRNHHELLSAVVENTRKRRMHELSTSFTSRVLFSVFFLRSLSRIFQFYG